MARRRDRVIALVMAILFFATSVGVSVLVLWDVFAGNKEDTSVIQDDVPTNILQGTKLVDFEPVAKVDSLQKIDLKVGDGKEAKSDSSVTVDYTGALAATGEIFQSSLDSGQQFTTKLDGVIAGWQEGVPGMKEGGKRRLVIPAAKAYGANPPSGIPANADLVFDIVVHKVE